MSFEPNNYTAIPNLVFDYWMEKLSPPEFKILCTLCRKIFGWHKTSDAVSIRQICKVTNLARSTVIKALKSLEDHRLLVVSRKEWQGCQYINQYSLNIEKPLDPKYTDPEDFLDDPNFDPTPTNNGGGPRNEPGVVRETDQGVVRETDPQKKDYTKERLTKDMSPSAPKSSPKLSKEDEILRFGEHESVLLTQSEYDKLCKKHGKDVIDSKIQDMDLRAADLGEKAFRKEYKINAKTYYFALCRWMLRSEKEGWSAKQINPVKANQEYAKEIAAEFSMQKAPSMHIEIEAISEGLRIMSVHPTSRKQPTLIAYTEKGFKDQVHSALRKWSLLN